jgi:hypoxanthine-guanine phosphoribosyltransferase
MNSEHRKRILEVFESDLAVKLLEFGENLSKLEGDVFVLMSRKFCCLYKLLLSIGITPIKKPVVSDKLLTLDTDFFNDKIVTILDDIIICGTSVWKAKKKLLENHKAKKVNVCVFCINEKYWVKKCVDPDYKVMILSEKRALTFCSSIVKALSISQIPYSVEFPVFSKITLSDYEWNLFSTSGDWIVREITNTIQKENDIRIFTLFPSQTIINWMKKLFSESVVNMFEIYKIRIYASTL